MAQLIVQPTLDDNLQSTLCNLQWTVRDLEGGRTGGRGRMEAALCRGPPARAAYAPTGPQDRLLGEGAQQGESGPGTGGGSARLPATTLWAP